MQQQSGPFKKAAAEELAKRRIVKARRSGSASAAATDVPTGPAAPVSKPAPASATGATGATGVFSWTQPVVSAEKGAAKDDEVAKETVEVTIKKSDTDAPEAKKDDEKKDDSPAKKPALPGLYARFSCSEQLVLRTRQQRCCSSRAAVQWSCCF